MLAEELDGSTAKGGQPAILLALPRLNLVAEVIARILRHLRPVAVRNGRDWSRLSSDTIINLRALHGLGLLPLVVWLAGDSHSLLCELQIEDGVGDVGETV